MRTEYALHGSLSPEACRRLGAAIGAATRPAVVAGGDRLMVWMVVTAPDRERAAETAWAVVQDAAVGLEVLGDRLPAAVTPVPPSRRRLG